MYGKYGLRKVCGIAGLKNGVIENDFILPLIYN